MKTLICIVTIALIVSGQYAFSQNAREISDKASSAINLTTFEMTQTLKIIDAKGNQRVRQTTSKSLKSSDSFKTLITFNSPADVAGTSMLVYDYDNKEDDMWIYMPALRKSRRIVSSEKSQNFMGSEFTNADMSKPNPDEYTYKLLPSTKYEGVDCYVVEITPLNKDVSSKMGFSKKNCYIEKSNYLTRKVEYFDATGKKVKEMVYKNYEMIDTVNKKYFAKYMEVVNLSNGRKSIITVDKINTKAQIKESDVSPAVLGAL